MFIAYISSPDNTTIGQIHNLTDVKIKTNLSEGGSASFYLLAKNPGNTFELLQEFNRVTITKQESSGEEKKIFEGYMSAPIAKRDGTEIYLGDVIDLMKTKFIDSDITYTDKTLDYILNDIVDNFNARFETGITVSSGITDIIPEKIYKEGKEVYSILIDLASEGYEFKIEENVLYFLESIGTDRSGEGDSFLEYRFDIENSSLRTMENPETTFNSENIANTLIVSNDDGNITASDATSIAKYGAVERYISSSGSDSTTAETILSERKDSVREIEFQPVDQDFFQVELGDTVAIYIYAQNELNNYIGTTKIIQKKFQSGDLNKVDIKVSTSSQKTLSLLEQISLIKEKQKELDL